MADELAYGSTGDIAQAAPFPWRQQVMPRGLIRLLDANNNEVPLLAITALAVIVSRRLAEVSKEK